VNRVSFLIQKRKEKTSKQKMEYDWTAFNSNLVEQVQQDSRDWLLASGFCRRLLSGSTAPDSLQLLPHTLLPSRLPAAEFERAVQVQPIVNALYHKVAHNPLLLEKSLTDTCVVDPFTRCLFDLHERSLREGRARRFSLALLRSDYMLDDGRPTDLPRWSSTSGSEHGSALATTLLRQVEVNTIASSLGGVTPLLAEQHKRNLHALGFTDSVLSQQSLRLPSAHSTESLARAMLDAWEAFAVPDSAILFVIDGFCGNLIDQKRLEQWIFQRRPDVLILRRTFAQLRDTTFVDEQRRLLLPRPQTGIVQSAGLVEIALVYMRTGYAPEQYSEQDWQLRTLFERSRAILCPSASYQLAGTKKMQQVLCDESVLNTLIPDPNDVRLLQSTFAQLLPLSHHEQGDKAFDLAMTHSRAFVLKPQR
jgi:glutathione synthetase